MSNRLKFFSLLVILIPFLGGCASIAGGVTEAFFQQDEESKDTRACQVKGFPFKGLEVFMKRQEAHYREGANDQAAPTTKILMVHGIGTHKQGYSTRLSENLTRELNLGLTAENKKEILIRYPFYKDEPLGLLTISKFMNKARTRELLFYELAWSSITEGEKKAIEYDTSGEFSFKRANINNKMKEFFNAHIPDPMIYLGKSREKIQISVAQSMCWMFRADWKDLENNIEGFCDPSLGDTYKHIREDDFAFISHSLGSRVVVDSLQRLAEIIENMPEPSPLKGGKQNIQLMINELKKKKFPLFMLANQLPLLQLGREEPKVRAQIDKFCLASGKKHEERFIKELLIIAFSDPNDILSYALPPKFLDEYLDSRLCPNITNVNINVAEVVSILGLGEVANPAVAHGDYDNDERVIKLIAHGIGHEGTSKTVKDRCLWQETVKE